MKILHQLKTHIILCVSLLVIHFAYNYNITWHSLALSLDNYIYHIELLLYISFLITLWIKPKFALFVGTLALWWSHHAMQLNYTTISIVSFNGYIMPALVFMKCFHFNFAISPRIRQEVPKFYHPLIGMAYPIPLTIVWYIASNMYMVGWYAYALPYAQLIFPFIVMPILTITLLGDLLGIISLIGRERSIRIGE